MSEPVAAEPQVDLGQRSRDHPVMPETTCGALLDQASALQDPQLLADCGLGDVERGDELGNVALAHHQRIEERAPRRRRDRVKDAFSSGRWPHPGEDISDF